MKKTTTATIAAIIIALAAAFTHAAEPGFLFVVDQGDTDSVQYYDVPDTGTYLGIYGDTADSLTEPTSAAFDDTGILYVVDAGSANNVTTYDTEGNALGIFGETDIYLATPLSIIMKPGGGIYVADDDAWAPGVREFSDTGAFIRILPDPTFELWGISDLALGDNGDSLYITDWVAGDVKVFNFANETWSTFGTTGDSMSIPYSLAFAQNGNLLVLDQGNNDVREFQAVTGAFLGVYGATGDTDVLIDPQYMRLSADGKLYVTDAGETASVKVFGGLSSGSGGVSEVQVEIETHTNHQIRLILTGDPGSYDIQYSDNVNTATWEYAATVRIIEEGGSADWADNLNPPTSQIVKRFYRVTLPEGGVSGEYLGIYGETANGELTAPRGLVLSE